jgi:catechol 2,3-dioxygenase-like lactoylglutathione lyase family enzyme
MFALEHIGLAARDPQSLKDWYERTLGAKIAFAMKQTPPAFLLNLGGAMLEIYAAASHSELVADNRLGGWRHIALKVESLDQAKAHLERAGVQFAEPVKPAGGGGRVLFFKDPEGNLLHLVERLPAGFQ